MNELSWMIYIAEVVGRISFVTLPVFMFGIVGGLLAIVLTEAPRRYSWESDEDFSEKRKSASFIKSVGRGAIVVACIAAFIGIFTPSKQTIYMVAASEAGEAVATSTEGAAILKDLRTIIGNEINSYASKPSEVSK